jgi:CRP/FNR family transcriptional regulator, cyclic AMP receptor protein
MPSILQSQPLLDNTSRSINAPSLFWALASELREQLLRNAACRIYQDGAPIQHRGDKADGFYVILRGQIKVGHFDADGEMQVLLLFGSGDSFGEIACLGEFDRVVDAQSVGETEIAWISDQQLQMAIADDPQLARELIRILATQLQESLDILIVLRKMPATKRLGHALLSMAEGRPVPIKLTIRQQDLAELVGVSRMTITTALDFLEAQGFLTRIYRGLVVKDVAGLRRWMRS